MAGRAAITVFSFGVPRGSDTPSILRGVQQRFLPETHHSPLPEEVRKPWARPAGGRRTRGGRGNGGRLFFFRGGGG